MRGSKFWNFEFFKIKIKLRSLLYDPHFETKQSGILVACSASTVTKWAAINQLK